MNLLALLVFATSLGTNDALTAVDQARSRLILEQLPLALSWHGTAALLYSEPDALPDKIGVYFAGATLGYSGTLLATGWLPLNESQAHLATALAYRGILAGHSLDSWVKFQPWSRRVLVMWLGSITAQAVGLVSGRCLNPGQAELLLTATDLGALQGIGIGTILNDVVFHDSLWHSSPSTGILPGQVIGAIAGLAMLQSWHRTEGQTQLIRAGGLVGGAITTATCLVLAGNASLRTQSIAAGAGMAGSLVGALLTAQAVRNCEFGVGNGWRLAAAGTSGLLAGAAAGWAFRGTRGALGAGLAGLGTRLTTELLLASRQQKAGWTARLTPLAASSSRIDHHWTIGLGIRF